MYVSPFVKLVQPLAREAVGPDEHTTGTQDAERLAQGPELRLRGRQVVEHREAADRVERLVGEGQRRRVADLDRHVRAGELVREARGGVRVELERDEPLHAVAEPARRGARPGADLEHLVARDRDRPSRARAPPTP